MTKYNINRCIQGLIIYKQKKEKWNEKNMDTDIQKFKFSEYIFLYKYTITHTPCIGLETEWNV